MSEPQAVIPLEYATTTTSERRWQHSALRWMIPSALLIAGVAELLIVIIDVESVMATGPLLLILSAIMLVFAAPVRAYGAIIVAVGHIAISLLFWTLVLMLRWSPREAYLPFLIMGAIYIPVSLLLSISAMRKLQN